MDSRLKEMSFLVGAFSLKEKSPTLTVSSFFFLFFSVDNLTLSGPLFTICSSCSSSTKFLKPESGGSILALNHNIFMLPKVLFLSFSALCDFLKKIFFEKKIFKFFFKIIFPNVSNSCSLNIFEP